MAGRAVKRKRRGGVSFGRTNKQRRKTIVVNRIKKRNKKFTGLKTSANDDNMAVVVRKQGKTKGVRQKKVKISSAFRKGVLKAIEGKRSQGFMREINNQKFGFSILDNVQAIGYLNSESAGQFGLFSPIRVLDAASCLFNGKNLAKSKVIGGSFPSTFVKVNVLKQWATFDVCNQSLIKKTVTFYTATQKGKRASSSASSDPITVWDDALYLESKKVPDNDFVGANISGIGKTFLYSKPTMCKHFNKEYSVTSTTVLIEPGQSYKFTVQGPTGEYDFTKFHDGVVAAPGGDNADPVSELSPLTKYVFYSVYNPLVVTATGVTGRFEGPNPAPEANKPNALVVEYTYNYKIEAPENTGVKTGGTATNQHLSLNLIRDSYIFKHWGAAASGQVNRIDEEDAMTTAP